MKEQIVIHEKDNVAVRLAPLGDVPAGHKVARCDIPAGGAVVRGAAALRAGDVLVTRFAKGSVSSTVT